MVQCVTRSIILLNHLFVRSTSCDTSPVLSTAYRRVSTRVTTCLHTHPPLSSASLVLAGDVLDSKFYVGRPTRPESTTSPVASLLLVGPVFLGVSVSRTTLRPVHLRVLSFFGPFRSRLTTHTSRVPTRGLPPYSFSVQYVPDYPSVVPMTGSRVLFVSTTKF